MSMIFNSIPVRNQLLGNARNIIVDAVLYTPTSTHSIQADKYIADHRLICGVV